MTPDEGRKRIVFHAAGPVEGSFLEMLRPYRGVRDEVLRGVYLALRACASMVSTEAVPRDLVSALWTISYLGRLWAIDPGGMLRRNKLISDADLAKLEEFLAHFDYAVGALLGGNDLTEAFHGLEQSRWRTGG